MERRAAKFVGSKLPLRSVKSKEDSEEAQDKIYKPINAWCNIQKMFGVMDSFCPPSVFLFEFATVKPEVKQPPVLQSVWETSLRLLMGEERTGFFH